MSDTPSDYTAQAEALIRAQDANCHGTSNPTVDYCSVYLPGRPRTPPLCPTCAAHAATLTAALTAAHQAGARQALEGVRQIVEDRQQEFEAATAHATSTTYMARSIEARAILAIIDAHLSPQPPTPEAQGRGRERVADLVESVRQFKDFVEHGPGRREPDMAKFSTGGAGPHPLAALRDAVAALHAPYGLIVRETVLDLIDGQRRDHESD